MDYHVRAALQTAHTLGEQLLTLAQQVQDAAMLVAAHRALGVTLYQLGVVTTAHTHFTQRMALYDPQQHRAAALLYGDAAGVVCHIFAALPLWILGYSAQGLTRSQEAVTLAQQAELYHLQGELLLQQHLDNQAKAEDCFQHAIAIAQNQRARSLELRAATSLARLWHQQGKRQKAHDLLAPVYNWFTEGLDTADLKEAKALLDALA